MFPSRASGPASLVLAGVLTALAAPSVASAEWSDIGPVFSGVPSAAPTVSFGGSGDLVVGVGGPSTPRAIYRKTFGNPWTGPFALQGGGPTVVAPNLARPQDEDDPYVWWLGDASRPGFTLAATQTAGTSTFDDRTDARLGPDGPGNADFARGYAGLVAAVRGVGGKGLFLVGYPTAENPSGVQQLSSGDVLPGPALTRAGAGAGVNRSADSRVTWAERRTDAAGRPSVVLLSARRNQDGSWGAPRTLKLASTAAATSGVDAIVARQVGFEVGGDRAGVRVAFLRTRTTTSGTPVRSTAVQTVRFDEQTGWGAVRTIAPFSTDTRRTAPKLVTDATNENAVLAWNATDPSAPDDGDRVVVKSVSTLDGQKWSSPRTISTPATGAASSGDGPLLALNVAQGVVTAAWQTPDGGWDARDWRSWDGTWAPISRVPGQITGSGVQMSADLFGDTAITGWDPAAGTLQAVVDDASGPRVNVTLATGGGPVGRFNRATAGKEIRFTADPVDGFSKVVGETTWDFGDGTTATGRAVTHTYAAPGTYALSVTSKDEWGYRSGSGTTLTLEPGAATTRAARSWELARTKVAAGPVRVRRIALERGWATVDLSRKADASVRIEQRKGGRRATWVPLSTVGVHDSAGSVRLAVPGIVGGRTYRVTVRGVGHDGTPLRPRTWVGKATRR